MKPFQNKCIKNICISLIAIFALYSCDTEEENNTSKPDINRGLVLYYNFDDGTAKDLTTNGFNGTLQNAPEFTTETPNQKGQAVFLNGFKENFINIPYNPLGDSISYSMSLWIKDFTSGKITKSFNSNQEDAELTLSALLERNFQFKTGIYSSDINIFSNYNYSDIQQGSWHLITLCLNAPTKDLKLYIDGSLVDNSRVVRTNKPALIKFQIGSSSENANSFKLDNFRIYNRCISPEEVKMIYDTERQ